MKSPSQLVLVSALAGMLLAVGFQASTIKFGSVDMSKVFNDSDAAKRQQGFLTNIQTSRSDVLEYINQYKMMRPEDAQKFKELSFKENATDAEKAQAAAIKAATVNVESRLRALQTKPNLSDIERTELNALNQNQQTNLGLLGKWEQEVITDLQKRLQDMKAETLGKARQAVQQVGQQGAYTIIFTSDVAPFAGTDVTAEALKAMNKIK